jgi:hypothetical protein
MYLGHGTSDALFLDVEAVARRGLADPSVCALLLQLLTAENLGCGIIDLKHAQPLSTTLIARGKDDVETRA